MKYTKRHIDNLCVNSLFNPSGTMDEKQAAREIIRKAQKTDKVSNYVLQLLFTR